MDSPTPSPNRDEGPQRPAAASDRERQHDRPPGDAEPGRPEPARPSPSPRAPLRRAVRPQGLPGLLGRSAAASVVGALLGVALALMLPSRPPASPVGGSALGADTVPPAPATRDETLARRRTLETGDAADTRPDDHALARRDRGDPPVRAAASPASGADPAPPSDATTPAGGQTAPPSDAPPAVPSR